MVDGWIKATGLVLSKKATVLLVLLLLLMMMRVARAATTKDGKPRMVVAKSTITMTRRRTRTGGAHVGRRRRRRRRGAAEGGRPMVRCLVGPRKRTMQETRSGGARAEKTCCCPCKAAWWLRLCLVYMCSRRQSIEKCDECMLSTWEGDCCSEANAPLPSSSPIPRKRSNQPQPFLLPSPLFDFMTHLLSQDFTHLHPDQHTPCLLCRQCWTVVDGRGQGLRGLLWVSGSPSSRRAATQKQARHASVSSHCQCPAYCPLLIQPPTFSLSKLRMGGRRILLALAAIPAVAGM